MANYYFTLPSGVTLPTDGNKIALTTACELHRDDSAVPNILTVADGTYNVFFASDPTSATAASGITPLAQTTVINSTTDANSYTSASHTAAAGSNRCAVLRVHFITGLSAITTISATWGTESFSIAGSAINTAASRASCLVFYMLEADIPAGAETITVTSDNAVSVLDMVAVLEEYENVNQTTPFGTANIGTNSSGGTIARTVTLTATDSLLLTAGSWRSGGATDPELTSDRGSELYDISATTAATSVHAIGVREAVGATGAVTTTLTASTTMAARAGVSVEMYRA